MKTLIKKAQHRDADAFVELMQENMKDMYKVARAILSNDEDAAGSDAAVLPVAEHDISKITVYLCDYMEYMDELKSHKYEDSFRELLEERAAYKKEVVLK